MINQFDHMRTGQQSFENSIIYLEPEKLQVVSNVWEDKMISEIEDNKRELDIDRFRLRAVAAFEPTLTDEEAIVFSYWTTARNETAAQAAMKRIGISRRTFFLRVNKVVLAYEIFVKNLLGANNV
jgi:uncharacterized protein with WD repeat